MGLKDLGIQEISERLSLISWLICGDEYVLLEENDLFEISEFPGIQRTPHSLLEHVISMEVTSQEQSLPF